MKDVDLVCDMITVCRERLETDLQYEKPLCDLIKVCGLVQMYLIQLSILHVTVKCAPANG